MKKVYIIIFLSIALVACNLKKQDKKIEVFREKTCESIINLSSQDSVIIPQTFFLFDWKIINDKVVFCLQDQQESFLVTYSYPSFQPLYKYGKRGQGPDEYVVYNWGKVLPSQDVSLYDIMKSTLYLYGVGDSCFVEKKRYTLSKDETGLCRPFTKCCQINDSIFLLKEDNEISTSLHLMNLHTHAIYSSYKCALRNDESSYTPFDYCYGIIDDHILVAYNYIDRLEFLKIDSQYQLDAQIIIGEDHDQSKLKDYNKLKYYYLCICEYNRLFYCLKSSTGAECGNLIEVYDLNGNFKQKIVLDKEINSINLDDDGNIVAYKENQDNTIIYFFNQR